MSTKTAKKLGLHHHIATGGKPSTYQASQGVNASTVPNCTGTKKVMPKTSKKK